MTKHREFDDFNEYAVSYRKTHDDALKISGANSDYFSEYKIVELLKHEKANKALKILDFGCGDGNSSILIKKYFPKAIIKGIDVSEKSIEEANKKKVEQAQFLVFNGKKTPFNEGEFDVVFISMVFHHINHKLHKGILNEVFRILKKGGRLYNFEHNPYNPITKKVVKACVFDKDAVLLKPSYHKQLVNSSDLMIEKTVYTLFFPRYKWLNPFLALENLLSWCPAGAQYYIKAVK